jgi:hypothetical protein
MNPRVRFRETLKPLLEELTIAPVGAVFKAAGAELEKEYIHLDIAEDGVALKSRLAEAGWQTTDSDSGNTTFQLGENAVQLILRTKVGKP